MDFSIKDIFLVALLLIVFGVAAGSIFNKKQNQSLINELQNDLAAAQGSIEILEGVEFRLAQDLSFKERQIANLLGENTRLDEAAKELEGKLVFLTQVNATLREKIEFTSDDEDSTATTTVIEYRCDEETTNTTITEETEGIPNLRVDFDLENSGYRVLGFTESNPPHAELSLSQLSPFVLDLALNQGPDGGWSAIAAEQTNRLEIEIGELIVNSRRLRERWYERFGVGIAVNAGLGTFAVGPALHLETRTLDYSVNTTYDVTSQSVIGGLTIAYRPFRRRR
jgi:hypothetical protein